MPLVDAETRSKFSATNGLIAGVRVGSGVIDVNCVLWHDELGAMYVQLSSATGNGSVGK